ncbi:MAG TPA: N-acetylmuramoyl-L-alanine amidase [Chthoniobacterales bacterium]|nr:N-acetylmuramoyl-L-alanine amidase [Chthoniobacterales bacterium]
MFTRARGRASTWRHALALLGLAIMAVSLVWLQMLPKRERPATRSARAVQPGPVSLVVIDAGHGGQDSGAIRNGVAEKDLTLDVAQRVERLAQAQGFATVMTRRGDETVSLAGRAAAANRQRDCVFVSIHFDEGARTEASGVGTFYAARQAVKTSLPAWLPFLRPASTAGNFESQSLAGFMQDALVEGTQAFNRGTRAEQFYVVANVRHPAVLVEGGFLSNPEDVMKLTSEVYREQLAAAITDGLVRYREVAGQRQPTLAVSTAAAE